MEKTEMSRISRELIASDKLQEVFDFLINYAKKDKDAQSCLDDLIMLTARFNQLKKQSMTGILSHAEESLERSKVVHSLLFLINQLEKQGQSLEMEEKSLRTQGMSGPRENVKGSLQNEREMARADEKAINSLLLVKSTIKILFLSANPFAESPLRLDREMRDIDLELTRSKFRDKFEFIKFSAVRISDLQDALLNYSPHFVHFCGHGSTDGIALLDNKTDTPHIVPSEPLANLFKLFSNDIACVFLNSCYSDSQATLIRKFIPHVIGMKSAVEDETAIEFAKVFYKGIGAGRAIDFSHEFAKNSIGLNDISGSDLPVLI